MQKGQFYCLSCHKLTDFDEADKVFRTGFFRIIYPLGSCVKCSVYREISLSDWTSTDMNRSDCENHGNRETIDLFVGPLRPRTSDRELLQTIGGRY